MAKIGFIGMGNMGYAMLKGALKVFEKDDILFTRKNSVLGRSMEEETGVRFVESNAELANNVKYLILAVKPQMYDQVIKNIENVITKEHVVISLAPGITIEYLTDMLGFDSRVVRAMPNTPALVLAGATGMCFHPSVSKEERETAITIFESFGVVAEVSENMIDTVIGVSGSSPAYVFMFIEAMADAAVADGMPRAMAYELAAQTVYGSAKMELETGKHPGELKDMVCSPAGTTIEAVRVLEEKGLRSAVIEGQMACVKKAREL